VARLDERHERDLSDDGRRLGHGHPAELTDALDAPIAAANVTSVDGETLALGSMLTGAPALVVFLRHFACPGCSHFLTELAPRIPELRALGVRVVLVGSGSPERLRAFAERMKIDLAEVALATDPTLAAFRAAGMMQSRFGTYGPRAFFGSIGLYAAGHYVKRHAGDGDVTQQGGIVLVDVSGRVVLTHRDRDLMDHASVADIVASALSLAVARSPISA
jgi:peroxiredoxin